MNSTRSAGDLKEQIIPCKTIEEFVAAIRPPRPIIIMIKAGEPVDQQMEALRPHLSKGDIMIDAGNANFRDTIARFDAPEGHRPDLHRHGRVRAARKARAMARRSWSAAPKTPGSASRRC